jgi:hypothetical protein
MSSFTHATGGAHDGTTCRRAFLVSLSAAALETISNLPTMSVKKFADPGVQLSKFVTNMLGNREGDDGTFVVAFCTRLEPHDMHELRVYTSSTSTCNDTVPFAPT